MEEGSPTCRPGRERVQTPKAIKPNRRKKGVRGQNANSEDDTEGMTEVDEGVQTPPRPRRTEVSAHLKDDGRSNSESIDI